jgi:hypothetical protein
VRRLKRRSDPHRVRSRSRTDGACEAHPSWSGQRVGIPPRGCGSASGLRCEERGAGGSQGRRSPMGPWSAPAIPETARQARGAPSHPRRRKTAAEIPVRGGPRRGARERGEPCKNRAAPSDLRQGRGTNRRRGSDDGSEPCSPGTPRQRPLGASPLL